MGSLGWGHLDNAESFRLLRIKVRQQHAFCRVKWLLQLGSFLPVTCWLRQKIWLNALVFGYGHKLFRTRDNSDMLAVHPYISIASAFTDCEAMFTYTTWLTKQCARFCCKLPFPDCGFKSLILIILFHDVCSHFSQLSAHFLLETTLPGPGDLIFIPSGWWHCTVSRMGRKMEPVKLTAYNLSCGGCWVQDWIILWLFIIVYYRLGTSFDNFGMANREGRSVLF